MSFEQEKHFEKLVPMKSALGREFLALQAERDKRKQEFESSPDKMEADTRAYRRSDIALGQFLDDMIPLIMKHSQDLNAAKVGMDRAEEAARNPIFGGELKIDRRSEQIIWTRFAIERYRASIPKKDRKKLRMYHPQLWRELGEAWKTFRAEIRRWQMGRQPYDGSQAMHSMLSFQVKARLLASAND